MLAAAIPVAKTNPRHQAQRHLSRRGLAPVVRRDARRFGQAMVRTVAQAAPAPALARADNGLRLFAHTFGGAFLFVTVFLA